MNELARLTYKRIRRIAVLIIGSTVVLVGVALLLLPGPGMLIIFLGIALLATEFVWARILLKRAREGTSMMFRRFGRKDPPEDGKNS